MFSGDISFQTIFEGASFTLEELGYGPKMRRTSLRSTAFTQRVALTRQKRCRWSWPASRARSIPSRAKKKYAFNLELNAFDLFETEAELELTRSKQDGSLPPNTLYFYVASSLGIPPHSSGADRTAQRRRRGDSAIWLIQ